MTYIELSKAMNLDTWFNEVLSKKGDDKLRALITNYESAYIECGENNHKYIKEIAKRDDTYLLCVLPTILEIKESMPELSIDDTMNIHTRFIDSIRTWAEFGGIPINKIHFADSQRFMDFCYNRDILIDTNKERVETWCKLGGVGILEEN